MAEFTVKFIDQNKSVRVKAGTDLLTAAAKAGITLVAACGGEGLCGKCKVIIKDKTPVSVLACQTIVERDLEIAVPPESIEVHEKLKHDAEEFTKGAALEEEQKFKRSPLIRKVFLEVSRPSADDSTSELERIYEALSAKLDGTLISTKLANVKHLGRVLEDNDFKVTAVVAYRDGSLEILAIEPGDTSSSNPGFAFDIGTTTIAGQLIDLNTGEILGSRIAFNKQARYGSDVITRIVFAEEGRGLDKLYEAVIDNINEIIEDLTEASGINRSDVYGAMLAGNMTMMHLLLKIDPSGIRKAPYVPTTTVFPATSAAELGMEINPKGIVSFLPGVASYVGGDIISGLIACGLYKSDKPVLLADIGTNGEIVLGNSEWMMGAAASAGPAFEGSGLSFGMKAVKGAIEKVTIDSRAGVTVGVIGNEKPKGICGSGYIDLLCQLLKRRIIEKDGKINRSIPSDRIRKGEGVYEFVVAFKEASVRSSMISFILSITAS